MATGGTGVEVREVRRQVDRTICIGPEWDGMAPLEGVWME